MAGIHAHYQNNHHDEQNTPRPATMLIWTGRGLLGLLVAVVILAGIGASYQAIATVQDTHTYPLPGRLVDVGGYRLHIYCTGPTDEGEPTVILESGLGGTTATWAWIQPEIAKTIQVCAYDRAGMGGSEPSRKAHDAQQTAEVLHALLGNAGIPGPYVLVGWSYGGLYMRVFADRYQTDVAGMVLLDSSHPDQCTSTPAGEAQCKMTARIYAVAPTLARLGVMRVMAHFQPASGLPAPQSDHLMTSFATAKDWDAQRAEYLASPATNAQVHAAGSLGDLPLAVVSATEHGTPPDLEQLWQDWQQELATLSTNHLHRVVPGASHTSLVFDAVDAQASIVAIQQVVNAARNKQPLGLH